MDYLSEGLTTSIILNLSQLPKPSASWREVTVFQYRGRDEEAKAIGDQLRVDSVLTGRVLQRGEALLINAELMDVKNGWQLWGAQDRRTVSDIFATEEEIAQEITTALWAQADPGQPIPPSSALYGQRPGLSVVSERTVLLGEENGASAPQGDSPLLPGHRDRPHLCSGLRRSR